MTELEKHIIRQARVKIAECESRISKLQTRARYIEVPFVVDGVFDSLVYDTEKKRFIEVKYMVGVGNGITVEGIPGGWYDGVEIKRIALASIIKREDVNK